MCIIISFLVIESMLPLNMHLIFKLLHRAILVFIEFHPNCNFPRIALFKGLPSMENFRETPRTSFRHFPLPSAAGFFLFPTIPTPTDLRAARARTSRVVIWEKNSLSRSAGCTVVYNGGKKKWIIPHLSFVTSLSNFYPFDFS